MEDGGENHLVAVALAPEHADQPLAQALLVQTVRDLDRLGSVSYQSIRYLKYKDKMRMKKG